MPNTQAHDWFDCDCEPCAVKRAEAFDQWEAEAPDREQRTRERLDNEGYYDDPDEWERKHAGKG